MNQEYHYDQVYSYEAVLSEVKALILPTVMDRVNPEDLKATGLSRKAFADHVYTMIMALGSNDIDINASLNDLMPRRNSILYPGPEETDARNMAMHLVMVAKDYKHQVWAFKAFHELTKELKPHREVIIAVKKHLLAVQMGF